MRAVDHVPPRYASGNTHRVVLVSPPATDAERLADLLADGLRAARLALDAARTDLPGDLLMGLADYAAGIRSEVVDAHDLLGEEGRAALEGYVETVDLYLDLDGLSEAGTAVVDGMRRALEASHRVAELLAAEAEIARHRQGLAAGDPASPPAG